MNYYEHHLGDYAKNTAHLTMTEDGAYRRLIDAYYIREKPLPGDLKDVCRLARANTKPERDAVKAVLEEFFHLGADGWHHHRCDAEIDRYQAKQPRIEARKENDRERQNRARERRRALFEELRSRGMSAPWDATTEQLQAMLGSDQHGEHHAPVTHPVTGDNTATHTPDTRHQSPEAISSSLRSEDNSRARAGDAFAMFWDAYPKKVGRQAAEKAFNKVKRPTETLALILKALAWQRESEQWQRDGGQYIPNPATYIHQGRWDDEQPTATNAKARTSRHSGFENLNYGPNADGTYDGIPAATPGRKRRAPARENFDDIDYGEGIRPL